MKRLFKSISWGGSSLTVLDQTRLPHTTEYLELKTTKEVIVAIQRMVVRGAPLIGVAGAFALVLWAQEKLPRLNPDTAQREFSWALNEILSSRPTAVNLRWALSRMERVFRSKVSAPEQLRDALEQEAIQILRDDIEVNRAISNVGATLIPDGAKIIHHCNTGALATADYGTALGVIRRAHELGKKIYVYLDETRPRFQGSQLSAWELTQYGVPFSVVVDSAAAHTMRTKEVDLCIVGCDRVALNGDTANKIGTYSLALAAKAHAVPFYVACPTSSIDRELKSGSTIVIEERDPSEITRVQGTEITESNTPVFNPAFDITPGALITSFITEHGVTHPPFL